MKRLPNNLRNVMSDEKIEDRKFQLLLIKIQMDNDYRLNFQFYPLSLAFMFLLAAMEFTVYKTTLVKAALLIGLGGTFLSLYTGIFYIPGKIRDLERDYIETAMN